MSKRQPFSYRLQSLNYTFARNPPRGVRISKDLLHAMYVTKVNGEQYAWNMNDNDAWPNGICPDSFGNVKIKRALKDLSYDNSPVNPDTPFGRLQTRGLCALFSVLFKRMVENLGPDEALSEILNPRVNWLELINFFIYELH
ncbi:ORF-4 [Boiling Springs Lake RNA-DNA hybrid virus]|uniref:ORF-4 n=1 Tax=Boiling Springs Lake RNA-DNA hybrid virus TaxID=1379788 RepID=UPI000259E330|nr:ORF-4 [Boiling Springs Lake RNA-DNA hybrid virus]AFH77561.1 ORF-4 [Boiling Springs Lake RNA-DNA hybrid virus]